MTPLEKPAPSMTDTARKIMEGVTEGPLVARCINGTEKPFAVINPNGPHGDDIVAGYLSEADAVFFAAARTLVPQLLDEVERLARELRRHQSAENLSYPDTPLGKQFRTYDETPSLMDVLVDEFFPKKQP